MKTLKTFILILAAILLIPVLSQAQQNTQAFWVHEDVVKPGMVAEYETVCKELTSNMKKHNIQGLDVIVSNTVDNRYMWVSPISSMADVERPVFKTLAEKMGADKMGALFDRMDKCYDVEHNYVLHLDKELSYMPDGITQTPEGQPYRKFHYFQYAPGNGDAVKEKVKSIKNLFKSKGSKLDYRVYRTGFGYRGEHYMVAIAAKDAADYANKIAANNELLGKEWETMYGDFMDSLIKYESVEGRIRPDMAYSPSNQ
ncbi:MAG: hypothetical protein CMH48_13665 [Muricauda sp.]|nr:hypothetical protein [Allomuricauda sp.]MAU26757.1 hypothetical protein [Allomuricauda sp.]MBC31876.1 hypothetical protein [Allomuricauda sp.]|tara:strand:+ start:249 stop:1016 length:768 start_codon:yes stop_codon:yes gene_type:complete